MRLKCETYSTLSDSDEDTDAEDRWQLKVTNASGFSPHNVPYISPAALYLTAIIECVHSSPRVDHVLIFGACEFPGLFASKRLNNSSLPSLRLSSLHLHSFFRHILSNIGRVTARDSSRTTASLQDLYTALCEDETIYGLFKNMKGHSRHHHCQGNRVLKFFRHLFQNSSRTNRNAE